MELPVSIARRLSRLTKRRFWLSSALTCLLIGVFLLFWRGAMPFEGLLGAFARIDARTLSHPVAVDQATLRRYYSLSVGIALSTIGILILAGAAWARLREATRNRIYGLAITLACSCAMMIYLHRMEYEGSSLQIGVLMKDPSALPIYGHRLLFVWVARAFKLAAPSLSDYRCFALSQCVATLLAVYALGKWSALFIGEALSWVGQVLGGMLMSECFDYCNFYDIGTVFFITCGLLAIYKQKYWWLVPIVMIGTLNHEGVLLLVPLAAMVAYGKARSRSWIPASTAALLAYCAVRFAMQAAMPFPRVVDWRIWSNMSDPFQYWAAMSASLLAL